MKLLSIAIPCYNSQDYMRHAIETLLAGGDQTFYCIWEFYVKPPSGNA